MNTDNQQTTAPIDPCAALREQAIKVVRDKRAEIDRGILERKRESLQEAYNQLVKVFPLLEMPEEADNPRYDMLFMCGHRFYIALIAVNGADDTGNKYSLVSDEDMHTWFIKDMYTLGEFFLRQEAKKKEQAAKPSKKFNLLRWLYDL